MNAIEDTQGRHSIVSDTLQNLAEQARRWHEKIDLLEAGQPLDRLETAGGLLKLLDLSQNLRDAILSEDSAANWRTRDELYALVARLDEAAARRRRYHDLAQRLASGTVSHRRERTREERLRQRDAAVAELMEISAQAKPPELPGPEAAGWLEWACSLDDSTYNPELQTLNAAFPRVDDFVRQLEIETWHDGSLSPAEARARVAQNGASSAAAPGLRIEEAHPIPEHPVESSIATHGAVESLAVTRRSNGEPRFFAADEVDSLTLALEKSRREPREPHTVRALLAISHWLQPWDQNPVLHPACGLAAEVGYARIGDSSRQPLAPVSAAEAEQTIATARELPLLAGGADLLRWSLAEQDSGRPVAALRRLTAEQLRIWFGEIFHIELAEPQVQDMYRLTYGIPLLVGELHRRIVPMHDNPPTWLGYAIWTRVKMAFDAQLPELARELEGGPEAVRLTPREIALLKMVVVASDDSAPDTLAANLMENWHKYRRSELTPLSSADETCLRVLQTLGLLPMRGEWVARPIQALLPVEADDPVRQLVNHL